jgi:hypothetical protein
VVKASDEERRIGGEGKIWGLVVISKQRVVPSQGHKREGVSSFKKMRTKEDHQNMLVVSSKLRHIIQGRFIFKC